MRKFLTAVSVLVYLALPGCHAEDADGSRDMGADAAAEEAGGNAGVDAESEAVALTHVPDPGPPDSLLGPKCIVRANGQPVAPGCISTALQTNGTITHVFVNFCNRNGLDECNGTPQFYVSLVLPLPAFAVGTMREAIGGRVSLTIGGSNYTIAAKPGQPIPIAYESWLQSLEAIPEGYWQSRLTMSVPSVDPAKSAIDLTVEIN